MTRREAKIAEVLILLKRYRNTETGVAFSEEDMKIISDALEWQAEVCVDLCTKIFEEHETYGLPVEFEERVINAGTEEV